MSASSRKLARLPEHLSLTSSQLSKLQSLSTNPITTCKDLLARTGYELVETCDWDFATANQVLNTISKVVAPTPTTVLDMLLESRNKHVPSFLTTQYTELDQCLQGGIPCSCITEIVGPPGSGKTQFCLSLAVYTTLPVDLGGLQGGVIYLDTEGAFSADRLVEIATTKFPHYFNSAESINKLTNSVQISHVKTSQELMAKLESLEYMVISHNVKLVILDSVASLVRKEFTGGRSNNKGDTPPQTSKPTFVSERNEMLMREASILKYIAESFRIPVLVTNQVTTKISEVNVLGVGASSRMANLDEPHAENSFVTAALGNTWAHSVTTRLIVEYIESTEPQLEKANLRKISVAKSPIAPHGEFLYTVEKSGIVGLGCFNAQVNSEYERNAFKKISTRAPQRNVYNNSEAQHTVITRNR
ncbi:DNA repair protein RAD51 [Basidiobolus ranarum]|uniref:DNA repair protein RAD51 n=1 Tax=Basidiobolus ranarum TaxID=34480 RepID=A0ABR2WQM9_9FUNG